ncbi:MAG TPA: hypothetical protein VHT34_12060 [Clostridia bacterium]|nr:hypothetical protein [Clostridia bacterium]
MKKIAMLLLLFSLLTYNCVFTSAKNQIVSLKEKYPNSSNLEENIYYPNSSNSKLPVVFLAHNGGQDGTAWGDFPQQIASAGFFTVNITYSDSSDVESAIDYTIKKYSNKIDTKNISFVGGCHGAKILVGIFGQGSKKYSVKSFVLLSLSEDDPETLGGKHPPALAYYSLNDELGDEYSYMSKDIATNSLSSPKKVISINERYHGDNMIVKASNKEKIRKDIIDWLKKTTVSGTAANTKNPTNNIYSIKYKVDNVHSTISIGNKYVLLSTFKSNIKTAKGISFIVFKADGRTPVTSGNVLVGMKLKVLSNGGKETKTYTIIR